MAWWSKPTPEPTPIPAPAPPELPAFATKAAVFNPGDTEQIRFGEYRANAIAREIEQRHDEGREQHPEHDAMVAEAMSYAWTLVGVGKWNLDNVAVLQARLFRKQE